MRTSRGVVVVALVVLSVAASAAPACSSFTEGDSTADAAGDDGPNGDAAAVDAGLEDQVIPPAPEASVAFPRTYHLDSQAECDEWLPMHDASFVAIPDGQTNGACRICGTPDQTPFVALSLPAAAGTYKISAQVRLASEPTVGTQASSAGVGFQVTSTLAPGVGLPSGGSNPTTLFASWTTANKTSIVSSSTAPDSSPILVHATIELVPDSGPSGVVQCYDVDEIVVDFSPG